MTDTQKSAKARTGAASGGFTNEEKRAMQERARELKAESRSGAKKEDGEADVLAKIAAMPEPDRGMAKRLHALVMATAPSLSPRTWYGMPAYSRDGKVICFFKAKSKFKERYATIGFDQNANLDDGAMWPTSYALTELTTDGEATIAALVKRAVS